MIKLLAGWVDMAAIDNTVCPQCKTLISPGRSFVYVGSAAWTPEDLRAFKLPPVRPTVETEICPACAWRAGITTAIVGNVWIRELNR